MFAIVERLLKTPIIGVYLFILFYYESQKKKLLWITKKIIGVCLQLHRGPIRGRMTDTDGSWETPHPSSVTDGMGGPTPGTVGRDGCLFPQKQHPFFFFSPFLSHQNVGSRGGGRTGS